MLYHIILKVDTFQEYMMINFTMNIQEILCSGGSLSHHHGIGKVRQAFLPQVKFKAAHSHRTTIWPTSQLTEKLETILFNIIGIIFYMTNLIVQMLCNR